jgi:hypothetical protein
MLLIGSVAAKYHVQQFRQPNDIDVILSENEVGEFYKNNEDKIVEFRPQFYSNRFTCKLVDAGNISRVELHVATPGSGYEMLVNAQKHTHVANAASCSMTVASLRTLLAIKKTHITFPVKWQKHIRDYHTLKQYDDAGAAVMQDNVMLEDAYSIILADTCKRFSKYRSASLDMTNEEFFAKSAAYVGRKYEHDDLHRLIMFYDVPMYTKLKTDQSKAMCLRSKWDELSLADQVKAVKEEAYVIALERKIIPAYEEGEDITYELGEEAFSWAIERICTTLTSGWFREFAIEHWPVCGPNSEDYSFVSKFLNWDRR